MLLEWEGVEIVEQITIGQISIFLAFIVAIITSGEFIVSRMKKVFEKSIQPLNDKIDRVDKNATMNYLTRSIADIERGNQLEGAERMRFFEQYEHYTKDLNGNTYIHEEVERLKREKRI